MKRGKKCSYYERNDYKKKLYLSENAFLMKSKQNAKDPRDPPQRIDKLGHKAIT